MEFEDYPESFQLEILKLIYHDSEFANSIAGTIEPEHFDSKIHSIYARIFLTYTKSYPGKPIARPVVYLELSKLIDRKIVTEEEKPEYISVFAEIVKKPEYPEYVRDEVIKYASNKELEIELINSVSLLKKHKTEEIFTRISAIQTKMGSSSELEDFKLLGEAEAVFEKYADPELEAAKDGMPTAVSEMDTILYQNGVGKQEMLVFCGSPGRGKSICLINASLASILAGKNVLFYTLEVSKDIVLARMYSCLTGIPFVDLPHRTEQLRERWDMIKSSYPKIGEITILDLPPRWLTVNKIKNHLKQYEMKGINFDMVAVDYADIMASDKKNLERRIEHGDVYENLRGVAKEFDVAVITASQANRTALRKRDVDIDALSEDFSKSFTADYVVGLSQDAKEEAERTSEGRGTGKLRWFVGKNRNGVKGMNIPMMTDFSRMRISISNWDNFDLETFGFLTD